MTQEGLKLLIFSGGMITSKSTIILILILTLHVFMVPAYHHPDKFTANDLLHHETQSIDYVEMAPEFIFENENIFEEELKGYKYLCSTQYKLNYFKISSRNTLKQMFSKTMVTSLETFSRPPPVI